MHNVTERTLLPCHGPFPQPLQSFYKALKIKRPKVAEVLVKTRDSAPQLSQGTAKEQVGHAITHGLTSGQAEARILPEVLRKSVLWGLTDLLEGL